MSSVVEATEIPPSPKRTQKHPGEKDNYENGEVVTELATTSVQIVEVMVKKEHDIIYSEVVTQQQLEECAEYMNKAKTLQYALETDLLICDAKWTLFVSATFSYRYDSVLQPFPPQFASEQGYDIDSLMSVIKDTPKLSVVLQNLTKQEPSNEISSEVIDLLYWVLIVMGEPVLRLVEGEELTTLMSSIDEKSTKVSPTHVFEVNDAIGFHSDEMFHSKTSNLPLKLAFMGNKLDNYFSILQNGFTQFAENGTKLELTTDLQTSLKYSPYGAAWGASQCGSIISCAAICEFGINAEEDKITTNKHNKSCVDIQLSNAEHIRLRYLIFYGKRFPGNMMPKRRIFSWLYSYKFTLYLLSYMMLLATIGFANSDNGETFKLYVSNKFEIFLNFCRRIIGKEPSQ